MKYIAFLLLFALTGCAQYKPVLEIISSDSNPLKNHNVVLYNGDIEFKLAGGTNPYPYKVTDKKSWLLDEQTTNDSGLLTLDKTYNCRSIVLVIGEEFKNIRISFTNNLSHTLSKDHIRIVDFVDGSTKVQGNHIYDLKNKEVIYFTVDGEKTKSKFKYIRIKAIKAPNKWSHITTYPLSRNIKKNNKMTGLKAFDNQTYSKFVNRLGSPKFNTERAVKDIVQKNWNHGMIFHRYPKSNPQYSHVVIKTVQWEDGDSYISACFHKINGTWKCLGVKHFHKKTKF